MASHEYYNNPDRLNQKPLPSHPGQSPSPSPSYGAYRQDSYDAQQSSYRQQTAHNGHPQSSAVSAISSPPSYASQPYLGSHPQQQYPTVSPIQASPFDTVFDDHVYPAPASGQPSADSSRQNLAQQDTAYYGLGHTPSTRSDDHMNAQGGIPLQDRNHKYVEDGPDHVYEAPRRSKSGNKKKGAVRFGELGMLGAYGGGVPWMVYLFTTVQICVFIGEIVKNATETGSPIMIHPSINPMIGPSTYVMINFGARFVPCMHNVQNITDATSAISWPCPNATTTEALCTLSELCGFGGVPEPHYDSTASMSNSPEPNQWWRFIVPVFMHAGLIHIGFNLLLQLTMGREMERSIGSIRFFLVYMSSGIFGFVMGGNYAAVGIASTGASGSLFGIIALTLLDLLYSWKDRRSPVKDLMFILLDVVISFVLGLLPGLDNFSHIGGFLMGLCLGISVLHSPNALRRRIGEDVPYSSVSAGNNGPAPPGFFKNPVGFFKGRKPLWWAWWLVRAGALVLVLVVFIVLLNNFYVYHVTCSWCKYMSCLPVSNWCDSGLTFSSGKSSSKRDLIEGWEQVTKLL